MIRIAREAMMAPHHGADAVEHHPSADDTRYGRGSRAKERAAASDGRASRIGCLRISCLRISLGVTLRISLRVTLRRSLWISLGLTRARPRAPYTARPHSAGPHRGNRGPRLVASQDCAAHVIEKAAAAGRRRGGVFEFFDTGVGALESLVLHQNGLYQSINRIR